MATARKTGTKIYVPSGAIFGLDNLKIGQISPITKLLLKTTKSPQSLGLDVATRQRIFAGKAHDCIKSYPKNVNVSVAMGLAAGLDADVESGLIRRRPEIPTNSLSRAASVRPTSG